MSRCFPYPPPGYEARERPELELLRREREKAKEKKQRRKEKRERKEKSRDYGKMEEKKHSIADGGKDRQRKADQTGGDDKKRKLIEVEQVEKSSITEEHGQPSTQGFCGYSDRTQSSAKRRKHDIGAYAGHNQGSSYKCNALESGSLRMEAQCGELLDNWKPLELQIENPDFDYEDWLLEKKQQGKQGCKNCTVGDDSIFWTSCYFPAPEILALPYVVPY